MKHSNHIQKSVNRSQSQAFRIESLETRRLMTAVLSGQLVQGSLATGTQQNSYTFSGVAGGNIELSAGPINNGNGLEIGMALYGPAGNLIKTVSAYSTYQIVTISNSAASSGTYTAVITSVNSNGGSFNFSAAALPAPQATGQLASNQGASGYINGQLDTYSFTATAGGTVSLSAGPTNNGNGLEIGMDLFGPNGALLTTIDASRRYQIVTLTAAAPASGTYYAVVRSASGYGSYNFSTAELPAVQVPDSLDNAGGGIVSGQAVGGYISGQLDAFSFSGVANGEIELSGAPTGNGNGLNLGLDLYTPSGTMLKTVNATSGAVTTLAAIAPTTGTYYAIVRSDNGTGGSYEFSEASFPTSQSTNFLNSDQGTSGSIIGQLDTYTIPAVAAGTLELSAGPTNNGNGIYLGMDLFSPSGALIDSINGSRAGQIVTLTAAATSTGNYYAVIRSANGYGGTYNFSAAAMPSQQVVDPLDNAGGQVISGQAVAGQINGQLDAFSFPAIAGGAIEMSSAPTGNGNGLNIGMDLFTPAGVLLKSVNASSVTVTTLTGTASVTGTYYAVIRSENGAYGNFEFSEASLPEPQSTAPLSSDQGVSGNIIGQLNTYSITAAAGGAIEAGAGPTNNGNGIELGLDLFDPDGDLLQTVSATHAGQDLSLASTANKAGTYYIVVRSSDGVGGTYNFSAVAVPDQQVVDPLDSVGGIVVSGQTRTGYISGQVDAFSFNASTNGTIELSAGPINNGNGLEIGMDLLGPTGALIKSISATANYQIITLTTPALSSGTYTAVIRSADGIDGNYNFTAAALPASQLVAPLASNQSVSGDINGNLNTFSIVANAGGTLELSAGPTNNGNGLEVGLDLFSPGGTLLQSINATRAYQIITMAQKASASGTYYAVVRSANAAYGTYNFSFVAVPNQQVPDPLDNTGGPITSGSVFTGYINGNLDAFSFAASAGIVEATAYPINNGNGLETEVDLFDSNGSLVGSSAASNTYQTVTASALAGSAGTYTAVIRSVNGTYGAYDFTATSNGTSPNPAFIDPASGASYNATTNVLTVTGPVTLVADPGILEPTILVNGSSGRLTIDPVAGGQVHIGSLSVTNGGTVSELSSLTSPVTVEIASGSTFFIDAKSQYDVGRGNLVISNGSLPGITAALSTGSSNGAWNGYGIISSAAANDPSHLTAVGAMLNTYNGTTPTYSSFGSDPSAKSTDLLIKYTYYGDANLDGKVDGSDYNRIDNGSLLHLTGWGNGDFDYSATLNGSDYALIDNAYNTQGAQFDASIASQVLAVPGAGSVSNRRDASSNRQTRVTPTSYAAVPASLFASQTPINFPELLASPGDVLHRHVEQLPLISE